MRLNRSLPFMAKVSAAAVALAVVAGLTARAHSAPAKPTFTETVAPILYKNCVTCHRPGEAAPFSLITYQDVKKRGALIAAVTEKRYMPPWHAEHGYGEFSDERRLTDDEIAILKAWVTDGMPEGPAAKMPKLPEFADGWHLGKPDLILEMPTACEVPADGPDLYRFFQLPTNLTEDKWVRAIEFRPSSRKAVHHSLFSYRSGGAQGGRNGRTAGAGGLRRGGPGALGGGLDVAGLGRGGGAGLVGNSLGGWAVGATPVFLPEGLAYELPAGSALVLQTHFHPTGKVEHEKSMVGIYFAEKAPARKLLVLQAPAVFGIGAGIDIAPGKSDFTIQDSLVLPVDVEAYAVNAHAHYLGKEMEMKATLPDGTTKPLLWIKDWDFNWQDQYNYKSSFQLPKGTRIDARMVYDNSETNPRNPSRPAKHVQWGEQSFDEMGAVSLVVTAARKEDEVALQQTIQQRSVSALLQAALGGGLQRLIEERRTQGGR
jgi:mono/diheme cytochrome c family protein